MVSRRLPVDVVRLVLDEVFDWKDEPLWHLHGMRGRCTWLAEVFHVSREWYAAGVPLLYRLIEISPHDEITLDLLLRTLKRRPDLAGLVRIVRPYEREYYSRDPRTSVTLSDMFQFEEPSIPFLTKKGRARWAMRRRVRKFVVLLNLCTNIDELAIDSSDVPNFSSVLKRTAPRLNRLVLEAAHRLDMANLTQIADLSSLLSLRLDASARYRVGRGGRHNNMCLLDVGNFVPMTRLVELEVVGAVPPQCMRDILQVLQGTLRSLTCDNLDRGQGSIDWLSPVSTSLLNLRIFVHGDEPMCNLGHLTALKRLHILVSCNRYTDPRRTAADIRSPIFPPSVERVEWACLDRVLTPTLAKQRVRDLLTAHDSGTVPKLRTIVVRISIVTTTQHEQWSTMSLGESLKLDGVIRGLDCRLEFEEDYSYFRPGDPRDVFAAERAAIQADREQVRIGNETRRRREVGPIERGLMLASAIADDVWTVFCCLTYAGCAACHCARYFD